MKINIGKEQEMHIMADMLMSIAANPININARKDNLKDYEDNRVLGGLFQKHFNKRWFEKKDYAIMVSEVEASVLFRFLSAAIRTQDGYPKSVAFAMLMQLDEKLTNQQEYF